MESNTTPREVIDNINLIRHSKPFKVVLYTGGVLVTLICVAGIFRVFSILFTEYNGMRSAFKRG